MTKILMHHIGIETTDMEKSIKLFEACGAFVSNKVEAKSIDKTLVFMTSAGTTIELISSDQDRLAQVAYLTRHVENIPFDIKTADKVLYIPEIEKVCYFFENESIEYMIPAVASSYVHP